MSDGATVALKRAAEFTALALEPDPGRLNIALRCVLTSALVIVISMWLQVPWLAVSLLVVFYVTQANVVMTRLVGILFIIGSTLSIVLSILVLKWTFDYPLVRILLASALFTANVYLMRITKLGVVFFLTALVILYAQTFVDRTDQAELLVRALLWVWVAVNYPIALALIINTLLLPAEPLEQLKDAMTRQLHAVDRVLGALAAAPDKLTRAGIEEVQNAALKLQRLLRFTAMRDASWRSHEPSLLAYVATVSRLYSASAQLSSESLGLEDRTGIAAVRLGCEVLERCIREGTTYVAPQALLRLNVRTLRAPLREMCRSLAALSDRTLFQRQQESAAEKERLVVPDAFHNPVYLQFTVKTLLACLLAYVFYTAVDWPGIHTVMLTCLIVAQPSLGATRQKALLRVLGAAVGSLLALVMMIWVVPHLDSIVGLLLMCLPVIAAGAWTAAGSERISYAGLQLVFTFSLALLERFGPTNDLTEIRDRAIGILLGVTLSALIHGLLWPEAEGEALRQRLAALLRRIAQKISAIPSTTGEITPGDQVPQDLLLWSELADCEVMAARVALEPGWQWGEGQNESFTQEVQTTIAQTREVLLAADAAHMELQSGAASGRDPNANRTALAAAADALTRYADALANAPLEIRQPVSSVQPAATAEPLVRRLNEAILALPSWRPISGGVQA